MRNEPRWKRSCADMGLPNNWLCEEVVLQKIREECDGREVPFLLSLGGHSEQAGDEGNLPQDVPFFHATHLPFPDHVHDLIALQGSPCRLERKETQPRFDASFDARDDLVRSGYSSI